MKRWISLLCALSLLLAALTGCTSAGAPAESSAAEAPAETAAPQESAAPSADAAADASAPADFIPQTDADMFTDRDTRAAYDEESAVRIELNGSSISVSSDSVQINGTTAILTEEATYIVSGTLDDGMLVVDADEAAKLQIVLDNASITSSTSAALYVLEADKVFVTLAEGSQNALANGGSFVAIDDSDIDGAVYSKQDLTFNGSGALTVTSPAGHGIVGNDDLVLAGGTYTVASASHGLNANDSVRITGETGLTLDAGKDGIHAENNDDASLGFVYISGGTFAIEAEGDGISAGAYLQITDGAYDLLAGGGSVNGESQSSTSWGGFRGGPMEAASSAGETSESSTSMKGLKAVSSLVISGGAFTIDAADDAVHTNADMTVSGGTFAIATGDDAFHADATLTVTGGAIDISKSYEGLEALHLDIQGGEISLVSRDDGLNAAGGTDGSGSTGGRDGRFDGGWMGGGRGGRGMGGGFSSASSEGSIAISGGTLTIQASGDGLDANGTIEITGGTTVVTGPTSGDTAVLDYDTSAAIAGGTFLGTGAAGMAQTFRSAEQGVVTERVSGEAARRSSWRTPAAQRSSPSPPRWTSSSSSSAARTSSPAKPTPSPSAALRPRCRRADAAKKRSAASADARRRRSLFLRCAQWPTFSAPNSGSRPGARPCARRGRPLPGVPPARPARRRGRRQGRRSCPRWPRCACGAR